MKLRPATSADAPALADLATQLGYPGSADGIRSRLAAIRSGGAQEVLVAEEGGAVIGWIHVFGADRLESDPFAEIGGLVVDGGHRGRGIGIALLEAAESWASERGYATMRIRSNVVRAETHAFYERRGYICSKRQSVFVKPIGPASENG